MLDVMDQVKNTSEPLSSLEFNVRAALAEVQRGNPTAVVYLTAAVAILEGMSDARNEES